jgi:hypothetical protein
MKTQFDELKKQVTGRVILPEDSNYDEVRKIYNGMINKKPACILKCSDSDDVARGINFARENNLEVSVKSGGHNGAGYASVNDGIVIDLSEMKGIHIDPVKRTAKIQAGCTLGEVDKATHEHGLALPTGVVSTTGIGGLTLGGGIGYLSRKGGLTIDNLLESEMVLANGKKVSAGKDSYPDLFWAIRGGGGNFGVSVSFTFNLIAVKNVYAGPILWPLEKASEAMRFYDEYTRNASNDLYGFFAFLIVPPAPPFPEHLHNKNVCGVVWNYTGPAEKREEVFKPIREFGPPILDFVSEIPMPALNSMFDGLYPPGMQWYWKGHYIKELSGPAISEAIKHGSSIPTLHSTTHFYPIDGKVHEVDAGGTAWINRDARWSQVIVGVDPDPANAGTVTEWCKDYFEGMKPYGSGGGYVNFMMEEGQDRIKTSYGKNFARLSELKSKYDPDNFFHLNQNIKPG